MSASEFKPRRLIAEFLLASMLVVALNFVIIVQGFSNNPSNVPGGRSVIPNIRVTTKISSDQRSLIRNLIRKPSMIGSRAITTILKAGLFGEQTKAKKQSQAYISPTSDWQVYVDQSRMSLDRGGGATFDAFFTLCYPSVVDSSGFDANDETDDDVEVQVIPAILPKPASGGKPPFIRCIWNTNNQKDSVRPSPNLDISSVDSVEKVYRVLTKHLGVKNISPEACECLKWKHKGNAHLESGEIKSAIEAYNEALDICEETSAASDTDPHSSYNSIVLKQQEGLVLLLRASAFLQQAQSHKETLQALITGDETKLPSYETLQAILSEAINPSGPSVPFEFPASPKTSDVGDKDPLEEIASEVKIIEKVVEGETADTPPEDSNITVESSSEKNGEESLLQSSPLNATDDTKDDDKENDEGVNINPKTAIRLSVLRMLQTNGKLRKAQLRKIQYRHGLYQTSLLQATSDSLRATEVLPDYPTAWLRAGDLLSDLWKIKESKQYYNKALSIDESLEKSLETILEGLEVRQELVERALANKLPEDSIQLALDVAG